MNNRILSLVSLLFSFGLFVVLFLPWSNVYFQPNGWSVGSEAGWAALAVVLVELLRQRGAWVSRGYELVAAALLGGEALLAAASVANVGTYTFNAGPYGSSGGGFHNYAYGGWTAMGFAVVLLLLAIVRFVLLRPTLQA